MPRHQARGRAGRLDAHLVKPVEPAEVLRAVEDVLARAAAMED